MYAIAMFALQESLNMTSHLIHTHTNIRRKHNIKNSLEIYKYIYKNGIKHNEAQHVNALTP